MRWGSDSSEPLKNPRLAESLRALTVTTFLPLKVYTGTPHLISSSSPVWSTTCRNVSKASVHDRTLHRGVPPWWHRIQPSTKYLSTSGFNDGVFFMDG